MKNAVTASHVSTRGNLDTSQAHRMTIDDDGLVIVMGLLSNLYSNGNEAVVREYACNARDSHVEAGNSAPIEITLPSPLNPQFQVQDYGLGMSRDEIFNIYAKYGASTKRDSNEQIGAFGIGAKSAFTVGTQFTVTGVKDGLKTIVMFAKRNDGTPTVQELFHGPTDEPNGVLVDVGVENVQAVITAAKKIFSCWKPGTVLVDGEQPETMWDGTEKLADEVYVNWDSGAYRYDSSSHFRLVMGGIPYSIPDALWNELSPKAVKFFEAARSTSITYVLDVPIGRVDITPNREELHITPRTRSTVGRLVELAANSLAAWITAKLDKADNIWEAAKVYNTLRNRLNYGADPSTVYWRGVSLGSETVRVRGDVFSLVRKNWMEDVPSCYRAIHSDEGTLFKAQDASLPGRLREYLFVTEVPADKVNTVRSYSKLTLIDTDRKHIIAIPGKGIREGWFSVGDGADHDEIAYVTFNDFWEKGKKLRRANAGSGSRSKTRYTTWVSGDTHSVQRNVDDIANLDTDKVYFHNAFSVNYYAHAQFLKSNDVTIVKLTAQQSFEVFKRAFPKTEYATDVIRDWAKEQVGKLSRKDLAILRAYSLTDSVNSNVVDLVTKNRARISNKGVLHYVDTYLKSTKLTDADHERVNEIDNLYSVAGLPNPHTVGSQANYFRQNFPLLDVAFRGMWQAGQVMGGYDNVYAALIDYINNMPSV